MIQEMMSDFRSDDSFPVKTRSCPTGIVDPSFDAEYPTYSRVDDVISRNFETILVEVWKILKLFGVYLVGKDTFLTSFCFWEYFKIFGFWTSQTCALLTLTDPNLKIGQLQPTHFFWHFYISSQNVYFLWEGQFLNYFQTIFHYLTQNQISPTWFLLRHFNTYKM